jgi:hypothetical protein
LPSHAITCFMLRYSPYIMLYHFPQMAPYEFPYIMLYFFP